MPNPGRHSNNHTPLAASLRLTPLGLSVILLAWAMLLTGCGAKDDAKSLEAFRQQWFAAANDHDGQALFHLLDASSKRWISRELDELRGLDTATHEKIIDQLGEQRSETLLDMTPAVYFDMLWRQATAGRRPTMKVDAAGAQTAYITLSLDDSPPIQIRLAIEGGQWVWQLPENEFSIRAKHLAPQP